jgi:hypothetical protein
MVRPLSYAEIGILIGLFLGLALMGAAWYFSKTSGANFCIFSMGEKNVCIMYISLYPVALALIGLLVGFIADKIWKKEEYAEIESRVRVSVR